MLKQITDKRIWNDFVLGCTPHTFLQAWEWGRVQEATGERVQHLGWFSADGMLQAVALVITVNARRGRHYLIPHGPVPAEAALDDILAHLRSTARRDNAVAVRIAPLLESSSAAREVFRRRGFRPAPLHVHAELTWVLDISLPDDALLAGMRKTTRHAIRKAQHAGITTRIINDPAAALAAFWPLYETTRSRHGFILWPRSMIQAQLQEFAADQHIFTVVASHGQRDVAAAIIPVYGSTAFYYHGASLKLPSTLPAAQAVQWAAIQEAKRRGAAQYNFWGIAPADQPQHPFAGITTFKKGFGGRAIDYLHAQDLPLSLAYWKLWAVDTWRKYRRGF